jgi:hypothetical protein
MKLRHLLSVRTYCYSYDYIYIHVPHQRILRLLLLPTISSQSLQYHLTLPLGGVARPAQPR